MDTPVDLEELLQAKQLEGIVDRDMERFSKFYAEELANGGLHQVERAAIKTYIAWKLHVTQRG